ncbi:hypothetical protein FKP32DRAFT_1559045 [Trametes sanguinea]|nr:hypothetical protein FKP32DRAFT_1559045 [Trametes sanguinea]
MALVGSNDDAVFYTAAIWMWNSDMETGNFVPVGQEATAKIAENRIQHHPNTLCQFSYAVDTVVDKTLYNAQKKLEEYVTAQPNFNRMKKPRRKWQEGEGSYDSTYIFVSPVFIRRGVYTWKRERLISYALHPWIQDATGPGSQFFANPDRPRVFEAVGGVLHDIAGCVPSSLQFGDLVWISFTVDFAVGGAAWNPNFKPVEIVRVGSVATSLIGMNALSYEPSAGEPVREASPPLPRRNRLRVGQQFTLSESNL